MLNNILFNESLHFFIKNNMTLTNSFCYKVVNNLLININNVSISYIEKFNAEYYLKKIVQNLLVSNWKLTSIVIQLSIILI